MISLGYQVDAEQELINEKKDQSLVSTKRQNVLEMQSGSSTCHALERLFCSDLILKFFVCACFGILPCKFKKHAHKQKGSHLTALFSLMHWSCFLSYVYFVSTYWTKSMYQSQMPSTVKVIQIGLVASGAFNLVLFAWFLYSKENNFSDNDNRNFRLVPQLALANDESSRHSELSSTDWLITNLFLLLGFGCSSFLIYVDFAYDTFYSFSGIHKFLDFISPWQKLHYHISVTTEFFGFYSTACAICVFHVITVDLIRHIDKTEYFILHIAKNREDFQKAHNNLLQYGKKLLQSIKWWFNIHTMFFFFLVTAMTFEWLQFLENREDEKLAIYKLMLAQISGSLFIAYKFAFPFLSAGKVTARYDAFYYAIARWSRIPDLPKISLIRDRSGIKVIGIQITTNIAIIAFLCSFLGALKLISGWRE